MIKHSHAGTPATGEPPCVVHIHIADKHRGAMREIPVARLVKGRGIEGDRYFGAGEDQEISLVQEEHLRAACLSIGAPYVPGASRRNLTVRGCDLNRLLGREFLVGSVRLLGRELCEPCAWMEWNVGKGSLHALLQRAGILAQVLESGLIRPGDSISLPDPPS